MTKDIYEILEVLEKVTKNPERKIGELYNSLKKGIEQKYKPPFNKGALQMVFNKRDLFADNGAHALDSRQVEDIYDYLLQDMFYNKFEIEEIIPYPIEKEDERIKGLWEYGENSQMEMENGYNPTVHILWEEMGVKPYNFNERFEEIAGRSIHCCLSEIEDGLECPEYDATIEKMKKEYERVEIKFDRTEIRSGEYKIWRKNMKEKKEKIDRGIALCEGVRIINVTPHPINLRSEKTGLDWVIPSCGLSVSASPTETKVGERNGVELCKTVFKGNQQGEEILSLIPEDVVVIGSIIAAQAYPGKVVAMTPTPGFERVPPAEKKMNLFKYTTF